VHIYSAGAKLLQLSSTNPSAIYTKWCPQTFPPIFGLFEIFERNCAKLVAPTSNRNKQCVVHLKGQSMLKKTM